GAVAHSASVTLVYAVEITAATPLTTVMNTAQGFENGLVVSNLATAGVEVQSEFLQNVNTLIGRVVVGCDSQGTQGVEKARVVMEDGSYAVTDKHGDYHFQAITNGTHVVQLDFPSLPQGYEPISCEQNTRWAGRDYSQFVEVHGGALWRADFHVRPIPGAVGDLSLQLMQAPAADHVHNTVQLEVSSVPVKNLSTTVMLPAGMTYLAGTARLDGQKIDDPQQDAGDGILVFRTGAHEAGWKGVVEFDSLLPAVQSATPPAAAHETKSFTIEGFPSGRIEMSTHDREVIQQIADLIKGSQNIGMTFVGYTDDVQLTPGSKYANNMELSIARAQSVADYLQSHIDVDSAQVFISGRGSNDPVATNDSETGRAQNRRTEIAVVYDPKGTSAAPTAVNNTVFQTRALASFDSPSSNSQHTAPAAVVLHALPGVEQKEQEFTLQDFASGSASLSAHDQDVMQQVAELLKGAANVSLTFVGYTDDQQVAAGSHYANNMELSIARAKSAADYVTAHLPVDGAQVFIVGRGSDANADGGDGDGADNRRIVIKAQYTAAGSATAEAGGQSAMQHAAVKGLSPADEPDAKQQDATDAVDMADDSSDPDKLADQYELDP
ncbi:MAG: OmpA family protein, partial [Gammaproteobacteria bacterium]